MTANAKQTTAFINTKAYRLCDHHRSCSDPVRVLSEKSEKAPNEPISNTLTKLVKAMPDMNKARSAESHLWPIYRQNEPISEWYDPSTSLRVRLCYREAREPLMAAKRKK